MLTSVYREILDNSISGDKIYGGTIDYVTGIITNELRVPKTVGQADGYITGASFDIGTVDGGSTYTPIGKFAANVISARYLSSASDVGMYVYNDSSVEVFRARFIESGPYTDMAFSDEDGNVEFLISSLSIAQNFIMDSIVIGTNTDIATGYMLKVEGDTYLNGNVIITGNLEAADGQFVADDIIFNNIDHSSLVRMQTLNEWLEDTVDVHVSATSGNPHQVTSAEISDDTISPGILSDTLSYLYDLTTAAVSASGVANDSSVSGTNVDDALETLDYDISNLAASVIDNDGAAPGANVDDAIDGLDTRVTAIEDTGINLAYTSLSLTGPTLVHTTALGGTITEFDATDRGNSYVGLKRIDDVLYLDIYLSRASIGATVKYIGIRVSDILSHSTITGQGYTVIRLGAGCSIEKTEASYDMYAGNIHVGGLSATAGGTQYIIITRYDAGNIGTGAFKFRFTGIGVLA